MLDFAACRRHVETAVRPVWQGQVQVVSGVIVESGGVPAAIGDLCRILRDPLPPVEAEVVGFRGTNALLMPHGDLEGIAPRQRVVALGRPFQVPVGPELLGRMLDGFGRPLGSDAGPLPRIEERRVRGSAPDPMRRAPIRTALQTGVRAIDGLATIGRGQRIGIFSGSGVGKSTLLGQITRGTDADIVVVCLVGERGREVRGFMEDVLGERRKRTVAVVSTSDRSPIERFLAPFVAVTIAEYFRDLGRDVLLVMDSITRFALAAREIGLAAGEPPTVRGFPPSFFATVPKLLERMGCAERGSITGLITVLLDADDPNDPVADTLRGLLDGHVLLSRELAQKGHYPAMDVLGSLSRLMPDVASAEHRRLAGRLRAHLAEWRDGRDLVEIGAYASGTNPKLDEALRRLPAIEAFLQQGPTDLTCLEDTLGLLRVALEGGKRA